MLKKIKKLFQKRKEKVTLDDIKESLILMGRSKTAETKKQLNSFIVSCDKKISLYS